MLILAYTEIRCSPLFLPKRIPILFYSSPFYYTANYLIMGKTDLKWPQFHNSTASSIATQVGMQPSFNQRHINGSLLGNSGNFLSWESSESYFLFSCLWSFVVSGFVSSEAILIHTKDRTLSWTEMREL